MKPLLVSTIAVLIAAAFEAFLVVSNYAGNVTGLFYTGQETRLPPELAAEPTVRAEDKRGYDGQFYHVVAHDPLMRRGWQDFVDNPRLRWRRIGLPGAAALIADLSHSDLHYAYAGLQLVSLFVASYWLAQYALRWKFTYVLGGAVLTIPAVLVSLDRMTVDLVLATLVIGFVVYGDQAIDAERDKSSTFALYSCLLLAPLVRETGVLLIAAWVIAACRHRRWRAAVIGAVCAVPACGWWAYVGARTSSDGTLCLTAVPFSGLVTATADTARSIVVGHGPRLATLTEGIAMAGVWGAVAGACYVGFETRWNRLADVTAVLFVAFFALLGREDIWDSAYAAGRTFSPLLIVLVLLALRQRRWILALPLVLILPRIVLQLGAEVVHGFHRSVVS